jgi:ATP-binding protein involved in chromosome partitioning
LSDIPIPLRIHREDHQIQIMWEADHIGIYPSRELRLSCHCATCREEMTGRPLLDPASVPGDVRPLNVRLVGGYAIRIDWSDGHGTGIYTYQQLRSLCGCERCRGEGSGEVSAT